MASEVGAGHVAHAARAGSPWDVGADPAASQRYLAQRLAIVQHRVEVLVTARGETRGSSESPDNPWPGLYVSDEKARRLLRTVLPLADALRDEPGSGAPSDGDPSSGATIGELVPGLSDPALRQARTTSTRLDEASTWLISEVEREADEAEASGTRLRLRDLRRRFALEEASFGVFVVALATELDRRFEQLYGYLNDDVTRRHPTVGTALELVGAELGSRFARALLGPGSPLVFRGLVTLSGDDRPWPGRELGVPDRVVSWCLGEDAPVPRIAQAAALAVPHEWASANLPEMATSLSRWLGASRGVVYVREKPGASGRWLGTATWWASGVPALVCSLEHLVRTSDVAAAAAEVAREATLCGAGLVAGPVDALDGAVGTVIDQLARASGGVVVHGRRPWDAAWSTGAPLVTAARELPSSELARHWDRALLGARLVEGLDPASATAQFRLSPEQVVRAAGVARGRAEASGEPIDEKALRSAALEHNNPGLERLARRVEPALSWDDLVLPDAIREHLGEIATRARQRETVLGTWRMRPGGMRGRGVVALFCGVPGTGKTMSAEVLAGDLGVDLYTIDLAGVIDKYVGETEKNLERIFTEADGVGGVLLFDEADALFAKRSEVRGANDRYANVEVAYLLQRMERFDGLALLSTNLRSNIDEAFVRRLDAVVEFPMPDAANRGALWDRALGSLVPRGDDLDLDFLAGSFQLSGGNIHSVCLSAAYRAAESGQAVSMADAVRCVAREYRKLGRLCTETEFGRYWPLVRG